MNQRLMLRLEKRVERYLARMEAVKRFIAKDTNEESEDIREWLESKCQGKGMDICCGYFPIGAGSLSVDGDETLLGTDYMIMGEALTVASNGELDYIVTNYFDVFPNPIQVLQAWNRALKQRGLVTFSVCDAEKYDNPEGALANVRRAMAYTEKPIRHLLARTGFDTITVERKHKSLLVRAYKI